MALPRGFVAISVPGQSLQWLELETGAWQAHDVQVQPGGVSRSAYDRDDAVWASTDYLLDRFGLFGDGEQTFYQTSVEATEIDSRGDVWGLGPLYAEGGFTANLRHVHAGVDQIDTVDLPQGAGNPVDMAMDPKDGIWVTTLFNDVTSLWLRNPDTGE